MSKGEDLDFGKAFETLAWVSLISLILIAIGASLAVNRQPKATQPTPAIWSPAITPEGQRLACYHRQGKEMVCVPREGQED